MSEQEKEAWLREFGPIQDDPTLKPLFEVDHFEEGDGGA
jgi:hypothetical protein